MAVIEVAWEVRRFLCLIDFALVPADRSGNGEF